MPAGLDRMALLPMVATILALTGVRDGEVVVDVGCGDGLLTHPAAAAAGPLGRVFGVDADAAALAAGRARRESRVAWVRVAADRLPFAGGTVDKVVCGDGSAALLADAVRVLVPGGRLVVATWGAEPADDLLRGLGLRVAHAGEEEVAGLRVRYASART
jgi:ubiquinone/menaquinone biosynthesis C-methylase UbiE